MKNTLLLLSVFALSMAGCKKADLAGGNPTGEGLVQFTLLTPSSGTTVLMNSATPSQAINFTWNASKPGLTTAATYKVVAVLKAAADFEVPMLEFPSNNGGLATSLTLTYQQLDAALQTKGVAAGATTELKWSVKATNGDVTVLAISNFNITVTRFQNGTSPFKLLGPVPTTAAMEINPTSTTENITFNWTKSVPGTGSPAVTYRILFSNNGSFTTPLFTMLSNNNGVDSFLVVTYKRISDSLALHGYADISLQANLKWTVEATSGAWKQRSDYVNDLSILRQVKFYLVGGVQNPVWNIDNPLEMITDKRSDRYGKVFYSYVKMNAGTEFKFFKTKGDWNSGYGNNGVSGAGFTTGFNMGGNFIAPSTGIYRLTLDVGNNMAYMQLKQVGVVGNMQGWNPGAPITGGYIKRDQFLILTPTSGSDPFKFHDGPVWDNGTPDKARWWGDAGSGNLDVDGNGAEIVANTSPRTRVIWDGTNGQQVKFEKSPAAEMRVVGDGMTGVNDWDPSTSPQMTYSGNGVWTISIALKADKDIKFLAGNAWGAFDYEDNSGQSNAVGTVRPIVWNSNTNFKTPASAGTYTITLNEYTQTVVIN